MSRTVVFGLMTERRVLHAKRWRRIGWRRSLGHWKFAATSQPRLQRTAPLGALPPWAATIRWVSLGPRGHTPDVFRGRAPLAVEAITPWTERLLALACLDAAGHA